MGQYGVNMVLGTIVFTTAGENVHFAGKLIREGGEAVVLDRLGSVRVRGDQRLDYYPYGEEKPSATTQDREKFATYFRDGVTNFDYAINRYYTSQWGLFLTPDPYVAPRVRANPQAWNRYPYVENDPVNYTDVAGLNRDECEDDQSGYCQARRQQWIATIGFIPVWTGEYWSYVPTTTWIPVSQPASGSGGGGGAAPPKDCPPVPVAPRTPTSNGISLRLPVLSGLRRLSAIPGRG